MSTGYFVSFGNIFFLVYFMQNIRGRILLKTPQQHGLLLCREKVLFVASEPKGADWTVGTAAELSPKVDAYTDFLLSAWRTY